MPKYSNPTGITFSDEVVRRMAALKPAAPDFRIYWDNAYIVHELTDEPDELLEVFGAVAEAGGDNLVYEFASTSKVTFPGSGIAAVAASAADIVDLRAWFGVERVCPTSSPSSCTPAGCLNADAVRTHMAEQAKVLRPRFDLVRRSSRGPGRSRLRHVVHPKGGYFVSFDGPEGSAKAIVALAADLGVKMTGAGATWPYGKDPRDTNIRIAPTPLARRPWRRARRVRRLREARLGTPCPRRPLAPWDKIARSFFVPVPCGFEGKTPRSTVL